MSYDMVKFERGQVWMVHFKNPFESVGREQKKDRPYLILSVGKFNQSSGMFTAVPITTRLHTSTPAQVKFENERGDNNVILCEQVRTFDHQSKEYTFEFIGNISREILEKVDVAISIHLGLHYSPITLKSLYDSMEAIIKSVGHMQKKANEPKFTDDDVLDFADKLQSLVTTESVVHNSPNEEEDKSKEEIKVVHPEEPKPNTVAAPVASPRLTTKLTINGQVIDTGRIKWTPEICREFINDMDTMPMSQVMERWNISKKARLYYMKNHAVSLLREMNQGTET